MSTSSDNLPAAPDEPQLLDERTRKTLTDIRWLLALVIGSVVAVFTGGFAAYGQVRTIARDEGKAAAVAVVAGLPEKVEALKSSVADVREEQSEQRGELRGVREDLRVVFPRLPALPKDGGP